MLTKPNESITHFAVLIPAVSVLPNWISIPLSIICIAVVALAMVHEVKR